MTNQVLFLDDDKAQLVIYKNIVSRYLPNIVVHYADTVSEAKRILTSQRINLAVIDLMIPSENGADLIVDMKKHSALQDVRIIVVTAADRGSLLHNVLHDMVDEFITKPINPSQFSELIKSYL